ncbi:MAG TPA: hypothetical protein PKD99_02210 [Sphingopyxis sp.]|nr:hypothetical protein [Sphingopyxis sp.]HMP43890.1 hypothetical protein [Sphingopyxis sp.]HMQ18509.1 hypothetical protein [Sphingopyxis sp.]
MSMNMETHGGDIAVAVGKTSPPLTVAGAAIAGVPLQDWVLIATLIYTVLQIAVLVQGFLKKRRAARDGEGQ